MKKLLIFMLVLGMTSVASAALSAVSPYTDDIVTWDVIGDQFVGHGDSLGTYNGMVWVTSGGSLTPNATTTKAAGVNNEAGDAGTVTAGTPGAYATYAADLSVDVLPNQAVGDWFVFDIAFDGPEMVVDIYNASNQWVEPVGSVTIIPEPMTIALLGLGGLFLLRRRK